MKKYIPPNASVYRSIENLPSIHDDGTLKQCKNPCGRGLVGVTFVGVALARFARKGHAHKCHAHEATPTRVFALFQCSIVMKANSRSIDAKIP